MKTKNINLDIALAIAPFLKILKKQPYVQGIFLLGGLGKRKFLDKYSDVDISIFTYKKDSIDFPLPFDFYYNLNKKFTEFNIHQQIIEDEENRACWDESKIEAYSRGKLIYDPTGRVKKLIKEKTRFDEEKAFNRLVWISQQYRWRAQIHSLRSYKRGYPESAHYLLNQCAELLIEAIYLLNKRYLPHKKWALVYLRTMNSKWSKLSDYFRKAMLIKNYRIIEIKRRLRVLNIIYNIINSEILKKYPNFPDDPYLYYCKNFVQINPQTKIDSILEEFEDLTPREYKILRGILCFNLIDSRDKIYKGTLFKSDKIWIKNVIRKRNKYGK